MSAMADNMKQASYSKVQEVASGTIDWTLANWNIWHKMLAKEASCILNIKDVKLRFFFRPFTKKIDMTTGIEYYSLFVQVLSNHNHVCLRIETKYKDNYLFIPRRIYSDEDIVNEPRGYGMYYVSVNKSAMNQNGIEVVDDEFFKWGGWQIDSSNGNRSFYGDTDFYWHYDDLTITITATLCIFHEGADSDSVNVVAEEPKNDKNLLTQIQRVLETYPENLFADVFLKMQDNVTLQGHRLILASASPVFEAMFTSGFKETQKGILEIPDVSSKVMKILIKYMYSGNVVLTSSDLIEQVIYAASNYQLSGLVEYFDNTLITICNPGNVVGLLKLAKQHNLPNAIVELENYTKLNSLEIVMEQIKKA